ncbi:MAG TPA: ferritin-like domain-containing protein [Ferrovibrio sp.]|uniref:ferritin-like domain-containing protein n=1 Tax=Ferrovibrio sp. TaxID=1917215 RepID=UPI002ED22F91
MSHRWTLDDIPWDRFDPSKVDPELLRAVKAAALVEHNADDYVTYLCNVFADDAEFCGVARWWGEEEVQHGRALARWAQLADPGFDPALALKRFNEGFRLPLDATASVRGSRSGELVARCVVECGTSSFYSAIRDATDEPVLKIVAGKIAADEFRHFKLFYDHLHRYLQRQPLSRMRRLLVALGRMQEASDDELAMAYWCGNGCEGSYDRKRQSAAYELRASSVYRFGHIQRGLGMALKACDIDPQGRFSRWFAALIWRVMQWRRGRLAAIAT